MYKSSVIKADLEVGTASFANSIELIGPSIGGSKPTLHGHRDFQDAREAAREEGLQLGRQEGLILGTHEAIQASQSQLAAERERMLMAWAQELAGIQADIESALTVWVGHAEQVLTEEVGVIMRTILCRELLQDRSSILNIVKRAVSDITHVESARIRINPFDRELLASHKAEIFSACQSIANIEIVDDPLINAGCVIETSGGRIDATCEGQIISLESSIKRGVA